MLLFKRGFARLGSVLHIFWTIENLKKIKKTQKISKSLKFAGKKTRKKQEKTK